MSAAFLRLDWPGRAPRTRADAPDQGRWLGIAAACALLYFLTAAFYVQRGEPNGDEGFYAYAAHNVMEGRLPYRDFAYTQTPALPYLQGVVLAVTGFGVREQRWLNAALGTAAVLIAVRLWRRAGMSAAGCLVLTAVWCLCPSLVYHNTIGKTYALSQLLLVLAGACLLADRSPRRQLILFSVCGLLAIGCRLTVAPAVAVLWIGLAWRHRAKLGASWLVGCPLLLALLACAPFILLAPANTLFWVWEYHLQSLVPADRLLVLGRSVGTFAGPGCLALGAAGLVGWTRPGRPGPAGWILAAGAVGWILSVGLTGVYTDYAVPALPLLLLGSGLVIASRPLPGRARAAGAGAVLLAAGLGGWAGDRHVAPGYLAAVDETVAYLRKHAAPDDVILSPMPEIPLGAGRPIPAGLDLGKFALTAEMDEATATQRRIVTAGRLWELVDRQEPAFVVLSNFRTWNFHWTVPSLRPARAEHYQRWVDLLLARYDCVHLNASFIVFRRHAPGQVRLPINLNPRD